MDNEELLREYAETHDIGLRNRIVEMNIPLAGLVAKHFSGRGVEYEDLIQIASLAMIKALERYQPERGKLSTFLLPSMIGEVRHYFRDMSGIIRLPRTLRDDLGRLKDAEKRIASRTSREPSIGEVAEEAGIEISRALNALEAGRALESVSLNEKLSDDDSTELEATLGRNEEGYEEFELRDLLKNAFVGLDDNEKLLLRCRYMKGMNQRDTAGVMNVSQMTVSRMEKRIIEKLREKVGI